MVKSKSLFSSALWNMVTVLLTAIAGFIIVPILIKSIGPENFGIYAIILMIGGFSTLQNLGLGEATLKYVAYYNSKNDTKGVNRVLGATLSIYLLSGTIFSGLIVFFSSFIVSWFKISSANISEATFALKIAGFAFLFNIFGAALKTIPEATQRYDILSKYALIMMSIRYIIMYFIAILQGGIIGLTCLILLSSIIDILVYNYLAKKLIPNIKCLPNFNKVGIKEVFGYGIFSFINDLIQKASLYVDQVILGIFYSSASVAFLSAPKDLITKAQGLTGSAGQALFPRFSSMQEGEEMKELYMRSLWILTIFSISVFVPLSIIMPSFLSKWLTPEFAKNSIDFATLYSLGVAFNGGTIAYFALLKGTGRIKWLSGIISTLTLLSGIITAFLVYSYGIIGSGIRILLFSWVGTFLCLYIGKKVFPIFKTFKVALETFILPFSISLLFFFIGSTLIKEFNINSWFEIMFSYLTFLILMVFFQFTLNYWIFNRKGNARLIYNQIREIKIVKKYL